MRGCAFTLKIITIYAHAYIAQNRQPVHGKEYEIHTVINVHIIEN